MSSEREPPSVPLALFAAMAATGLLLLAFFIARSGSVVAFTVALGLAAGLWAVAAALWWRGRQRVRPRQTTGNAAQIPLSRPASATVASGSAVRRDKESETSGDAVQVLAHLAIRQFDAPASAVLVVEGRQLVPATSAGDWAVARQGVMTAESPAIGYASTAGDEPPSFPLDPKNDWLERFLGLYQRPVPMERWHELSDVPPPLVPLVGLASSGVGVAVPLTYRRRLYGLWVLAQRPGERHYADTELTAIERIAREHGQQLGSTINRRGP